MDRTVIDITQLGFLPLADICLQGISCMFEGHNNFRNVCALRTALKFQILTLQYVKCPIQPAYHWCFQDWSVSSPYIPRQRARGKYVSVYPNGDLKPQVKIGTSSGLVVLNDLQWIILVTFKSNISKNEVHELGDSRQTLSVYCGRYIRITSENTQVYLSIKDWSQLMDLASACTDRQVI